MLRYLPFKFSTLLTVWFIICAITLVTCYAMNLDIVGYGLAVAALGFIGPFKPSKYHYNYVNKRWETY